MGPGFWAVQSSASMPSFGTVSDHRRTIHFEEPRRNDPALAKRWGANPTPAPRDEMGSHSLRGLATASGAEGARVRQHCPIADTDANGGLIERIDQRARRWADEQARAESRAGGRCERYATAELSRTEPFTARVNLSSWPCVRRTAWRCPCPPCRSILDKIGYQE